MGGGCKKGGEGVGKLGGGGGQRVGVQNGKWV